VAEFLDCSSKQQNIYSIHCAVCVQVTVNCLIQQFQVRFWRFSYLVSDEVADYAIGLLTVCVCR